MWSLSLETSYWLMFKTELLIHRKLHLVIDIWSVLQLNVTDDNLILKNTMKKKCAYLWYSPLTL